MTPCERHELELSALLDGEVDRQTLTSTLDHLASCPACRGFYRRARALDGTLALVREGESGEPPPPELWESIRRRAQQPRRRRAGGIALWRIAAALAVGVGALWLALDAPSFPAPGPRPGKTLEVRVEEKGDEMTDQRFLDITSELLRADRSYQQALGQLLTEVNRINFGDEGSIEGVALEADAGGRPRV
jgi:predicted anti-sigma-YlaC factor YlaD